MMLIGSLKMDDAVTYRQFQLSDQDKIFKLTKLVWGDSVPEKDVWTKGWQWLHLLNPAGKSIIEISEKNGLIVGQYPLILHVIKVGPQIVTGSQIVDTMTHPDERKSGISSKLGELVLNELSDRGISIAIGFPNQKAYPFHMKRGWTDIGPFNAMLKPVNAKHILKEYNLKGLFLIISANAIKFIKILLIPDRELSTSFTIREIFRFDERVTKMWESLSNQYQIAIVRNDKYLNWRYIDNPTMKYSVYIAEEYNDILGYIVLGDKFENDFHIGIIYDIIGALDRNDIIRSLIEKAVEFFEERGVDMIYCKMISDKDYSKNFILNGFIPNINKNTRFIIYCDNHRFTDEFVRNSKNWFVQAGDLPSVY